MQGSGRSLWSQIPRSIWLEIVPIVTTALFVSGGEATAEIVTRLREGKPFREAVSHQAVTDLNGILLMINLAVVLWFGYRALEEALSKTGAISLTAKLVGIGTAAVTSAELFSRAVKSAQPERIVFCLLVLFYVFVVPFFLMRTVPPAALFEAKPPEGEREIASRALASMEIVFYAVAPCVAAVVGCSLYFAVFNEGIQIAGHPLIPSFFEGMIPPPDRIAFWGFSPGILGIGWLSAILLHAASKPGTSDAAAVTVGGRGRAVCLVAAYGFGLVLAATLVANDSLRPAPGTSFWTLLAAKEFLGASIVCAFLSAHRAALWVDRKPWRLPVGFAVQAFAFVASGAVSAFIVIGLRSALGGTTTSWPILVGLHAAGFGLAFVTGRLALAALRRWFTGNVDGVIGAPRVRPVPHLPREDSASAAAPTGAKS